MNNETPPLVEVRQASKKYQLERITVDVLREVTLSVRKGERVSIMGASGAGKSTLLHLLGGLDRPTTGQVLFEGRDLYEMSAARRTEMRATRVGFVFQAYHLLPELDLVDNVMLPALSRPGALRRMDALRERALGLLDRVGLKARGNHRPLELSGGEQQRAALARALMNAPDLLLADEPTGNLDSATGRQILDYLFALVQESGHTLILVTHNDAVAALCGRQLVLRDGRLAG